MGYSPQSRTTLPSIIVPGSDRYRSGHDGGYSQSIAMSIPGTETQDHVPPPLPPPRYLPGFDAPFQPRDMPRDTKPGFGSVSSIGSRTSDEDRHYFRRRDLSSLSRASDADSGYASFAGSERSDSFPPEFGLQHNKFKFQSPADIHGDSLKQKLNTGRSMDKPPSISLLSASANELLSRPSPTESRFPHGSMSMQLPLHTRIIESPSAHFTESPIYSALSPRTMPFHHHGHERSQDGSEMDRSPMARSTRNNSDAASSTQGSYELNGPEDMEIDETSSLKRLHIDDAYAGAPKRRAASQSHEEPGPHGIPIQADADRRRDTGSRISPPRLTTSAQAPSLPALSRSSSYVSTLSVTPSTAATANSYEMRSPGGFSAGAVSPPSCNSPYATAMSLNPNPQPSTTRGNAHSRTVSATSPRKIAEGPKALASKMPGFFMCDCCPKKPKKFETKEDLDAHAAEKQYNCLYCGNRFKNKNEAERHQNSLHVRRQSWSCSALSGYGRAFHESSMHPGDADTCGYCGKDFIRSGRGPAGGPRSVTDQDMEDRVQHLQEVHKFRECNSSKKFYRADHFRQHLKHSHAGTSGKWTNMLETACMVQEDPTPR